MRIIFFLTFIFYLTACNKQTKFDKIKWLIRDDMEYPYRRTMLKDLTTNYQIRGLSYKQLSDLLGEPFNNTGDSSLLYYPVYEYYGSDIDPIHTISLDINLSKDSTVSNFKINEWKK